MDTGTEPSFQPQLFDWVVLFCFVSLIYLLYVYGVLPIFCMCTTCIPGAHESQQWVLDTLVPELWLWELSPGPLQEQQVILTDNQI